MNKTLSLMGICRRAGRLLPGHDIAFGAVRSGTAALIILTSDASARHERELVAAGYSGAAVRLNISAEAVAPSVGKKSCIYAVTDRGFAEAIEKNIREEGILYDHNDHKI